VQVKGPARQTDLAQSAAIEALHRHRSKPSHRHRSKPGTASKT